MASRSTTEKLHGLWDISDHLRSLLAVCEESSRGVEVTHFRESALIHGYFSLGAVSPAADAARLRACAAFKQMLA